MLVFLPYFLTYGNISNKNRFQKDDIVKIISKKLGTVSEFNVAKAFPSTNKK